MRASAAAFCYHRASFIGGFVPLVLTYLAARHAGAMILRTGFGALAFVLSLIFAPETKGKVLVPDLVVA